MGKTGDGGHLANGEPAAIWWWAAVPNVAWTISIKMEGNFVIGVWGVWKVYGGIWRY